MNTANSVHGFCREEAQTFCDLIGCNLDPAEIFASTIKHHSGGKP